MWSSTEGYCMKMFIVVKIPSINARLKLEGLH